MGEAHAKREQAEAVLAEALRRCEDGELPELAELQADNPELVDELALRYPDWLSFGARLRHRIADGATDLDLVGSLVTGRYRLVRRLEERDASTVYEAKDEGADDRPVAVELFEPAAREKLATTGGRERVATLLAIEGERAIGWRDFGDAGGGTAFAVSDLLPFRELELVLELEGYLAPRRATRVVADVLEALVGAQDAGLVGAGLRLDQVLLVRDAVDGTERAHVRFDAAGYLVGGEDARVIPTGDARTDVRAAAVVGLHALTGQTPDERIRVPRGGRALGAFLDRCLDEDRCPRDAADARRACPSASTSSVAHAVLGSLAAVGALVLLVMLPTWLGGPESRVLFAAAGGGQLVAEPLFMGPERREVRLTFDGRERAAEGEELSLVLASTGEPLDGFRAHWNERGEIVLSGPEGAPFLREDVRLEPLGDARRRVAFEPFTLVFIDADAWRLATVAFDGVPAELDERVTIDPDDLTLSVRVEGLGREEVSRALVRARGTTVDRAFRMQSTGVGEFELPLAELSLKPGPAELVFELRDAAGRESRRELSTLIVKTPLSLAVVELFHADDTGEPRRLPHRGERVFLSPLDRPVLQVELDRPAELVWRVEVDGAVEPEERGVSPAQREHRIDLTHLRERWGERSLAGTIAFSADESTVVMRSSDLRRERGTRTGELSFAYGPARVHLSCVLAFESERRELSGGERTYTHGRGAFLAVLESAVPARVFAVLEHAGAVIQEESFDLAADREVPLDLAREGVHTLRLQAFRTDPGSGEPVDVPDVAATYELVVVPRGARVEVAAPADLTWTDASRPELAAVLFGGSALSAPVAALEASFSSGDGEPARFTVPGPLFAIALPEPAADGPHELVVGGRDAAGNGLVPASVSIEVAREGPVLELQRPHASAPWFPEPDGTFDLRLSARDPNGTSIVDCVVEGPGVAPIYVSVVEVAPGEYEGELELPLEWDESTAILIRVEAADFFANRAELVARTALAPREDSRVRPERVVVRFGEIPVGDMRLVPGNAGFPYVFGGRDDALETELFESAGLVRFSAAWGIELSPGTVPDYYLDEREVSCEEFLQFVVADDGYVDPSRWPANAAGPQRRRMAVLLTRLRERASASPAIGVTWEEAAAYATWVEKRLPSLLEWEYAVRGGDRYRPQVDRESGVLDLCSGVAEWTATPWSAEDVRAPARALALRAVEAGAPAGSFWIAGGTAGSSSANRELVDFAVLDDRPPHWSGERVGFRCALSADVLESRLSEEGGRTRFAAGE